MLSRQCPGGPCPVCDSSGLLLRHYGDYGGYRTIVHLDEHGREQTCMLPEAAGMLFTRGGRWRYRSQPSGDSWWVMTLHGVQGGPCPHCGLSGELLDDSGSYDPGGMRTLVHLDERGAQHACVVGLDAGRLDVSGGRWRFLVPNPEVGG